MKKIVALLMASAMAASLAACGGNTQNSEATSATCLLYTSPSPRD